jgi:predicted nucleic acid-binding protein
VILVDSGFLLALAQPADGLHTRAVTWAQHVSEPLLVTEHVLWETLNSLSKRADRNGSAHGLSHF